MRKELNQKIAFTVIKLLGLLVIGILVWIQIFIIYNGIGVISWEYLTQPPSEGVTPGGIFPAIVGTLCLVTGSMIFAFPLGVMAGI